MARFLSRIACASALVSSFAMAATPAAAAQIDAQIAAAPVPIAKAWSVEDETVHRSRWGGYGGYRGYGGYGGYGGWYGGRHRHRGADAGDILAGVLIIGGIAAIATAAARDNDRRQPRYRDPNGYPYRTPRDRDRDVYNRDRDNYRGSDSGPYDSRGLGGAADICAREVGRTEGVDRIDSVNRSGDGWRVTGSTRNGRGFTCSIDNSGRVIGVDMGGQASTGGQQWNDDDYDRARAEQDGDSNA